MAWSKHVPEYAVPYVEKNMIVRVQKGREDTCYLYQRTSKRVPERKYPIPVEKYLGVITRTHGFVPCTHRLVEESSVEVAEYGLSHALQLLAPESWKKAAGDDWEDILSVIITELSPISYVRFSMKNPMPVEIVARVKTQKKSFWARLQKERKITLEDLEPLRTIYLLTYGKDQRMLSKINDDHYAVLDKINISIQLEVC